jgi:hypothetical protein
MPGQDGAVVEDDRRLIRQGPTVCPLLALAGDLAQVAFCVSLERAVFHSRIALTAFATTYAPRAMQAADAEREKHQAKMSTGSIGAFVLYGKNRA